MLLMIDSHLIIEFRLLYTWIPSAEPQADTEPRKTPHWYQFGLYRSRIKLEVIQANTVKASVTRLHRKFHGPPSAGREAV